MEKNSGPIGPIMIHLDCPFCNKFCFSSSSSISCLDNSSEIKHKCTVTFKNYEVNSVSLILLIGDLKVLFDFGEIKNNDGQKTLSSSSFSSFSSSIKEQLISSSPELYINDNYHGKLSNISLSFIKQHQEIILKFLEITTKNSSITFGDIDKVLSSNDIERLQMFV